ncbi:MAG: hypothetical protein K8H88_03385 [Sandaracinaceae bacterium]|nr:hypothetical protein [Sandaracinaceae bacterium]
MGLYSGPTDRVNRIVLTPAITRAFWSRRRAWNGADVVMTIETKWVPDGTAVKVAIFEDDSAEGNEDDFIEELSGLSIEGGRCVIEHTLEWDAEKLGEEIATEGGELEFYFRVTIEDFDLTKKSTLLYVDLGGFEVGR